MIECVITSPKKTEVYKEILDASLPAFSGQMQILPGHAEAFVVLRRGNIVLRQSSGKIRSVEIEGGQCHIKNNRVVVIL